MKYPRSFNITTKFILWFLVIALVPLIIAISISYNSSQAALRKEVANSLVAIANNKAYQIESFLIEKKKNVSLLSYDSDIIEIMGDFNDVLDRSGFDSEEYIAIEEEHRSLLTYYNKTLGYEDIFLVRPNGDVAFSVNKTKDVVSLYEIALSKKPSELVNIFIESKKSLKIETSDFEYNDITNRAALFIGSPLFRGAEFIGVLILKMDNSDVSRFVLDYKGLGKTAETIVASKINNEIVCITPLRFDKDAAFKRKLPLGSRNMHYLQDAVEGKDGIGIFTDYRNNDALTVWRHLPSFRWGMAVKMDSVEVFKSAKDLRDRLIEISLILLLVVMIMAVVIARSVSSPIKNLTRVSKVISRGNLLARAKVNTKDELGELAESFNYMTDKLIEAKAKVEEKNNQLQEQKILLEKVNKELDSFVYTVSHDLKTPLNGIYGFTDLLEKDYFDKVGKNGQEYLGRIRHGVERMRRLIEDLLALSRISRIKNPFEDVDVNQLLESVMDRIEFEIKKNNVELSVAKGLPILHCDRIKMEEVFLNLMTNAIKFSSKDRSNVPKIEIGYHDRQDAYEFYIKDNGIGIEKKYHKEIFDIFRRLHHQKEYEGTGAGLSIVKRVIDDHNGRIWVESELGQGTTFCFTIPKKGMKRKKLGEILLAEGTISKEDLKKALEKQGIDDINVSS
ncbi:MAG: ATP-binding protein [Candidatus Omnitrophota bacterium]